VAKQAFEKKLAELEALRHASDSAAVRDALRKALKDRNNYLVSKAAAIAGDLRIEELTDDLIAAFDRFFIDPVKSDPQCWAKNAIAKALKDLCCRQAAVFLRGADHVQLEPVWGGSADSAATLRGACTLALVDCQMDDLEILNRFADRLADRETPVRVDAALAIAQFGREEGALLLRMKLLAGDKEPEVLGQCFSSLLSLAPARALRFIERFLNHDDEGVRAEAAAALAAAREPETIEIVKRFWKTKVSREIRRAILIALGASPRQQAAEFLLSVLSEESVDFGPQALTALASSRFRVELLDRVKAIVEAKQDAELSRTFTRLF
jgi:HEAT repeat protein